MQPLRTRSLLVLIVLILAVVPTRDPLPDRHDGKHAVHQMGRRIGHAAAVTGGAESSALAGTIVSSRWFLLSAAENYQELQSGSRGEYVNTACSSVL